MTFEEAFELIGRDEAFRATVYAMNTLLTNKGIYSAEEFQALFIEHAINFRRKAASPQRLETVRGAVHANP